MAPATRPRLATLARRDLVELIDDIEENSGETAADCAMASMSAFIGWCLERQYIDASPVVGIKRRAEGASRERVLAEAELAAIWKACQEDDHGAIVRLRMLTGQRREEICSWDGRKGLDNAGGAAQGCASQACGATQERVAEMLKSEVIWGFATIEGNAMEGEPRPISSSSTNQAEPARSSSPSCAIAGIVSIHSVAGAIDLVIEAEGVNVGTIESIRSSIANSPEVVEITTLMVLERHLG